MCASHAMLVRLRPCTYQVDCAETIRYLMDANIHFWLLTGDKRVRPPQDRPRQCRYCRRTQTIFPHAFWPWPAAPGNGHRRRRAIGPPGRPHVGDAARSRHARCRGPAGGPFAATAPAGREARFEGGGRPWLLCCAAPCPLAEPALRPRGALLRRWTVLVVDGATLYFLLDSVWSDAFLRLAESTRSVICCRVTPLQKAQVVQLVKSMLNRVRGLTGNPEPERGGADSCPAHALVSVHRSALALATAPTT